MSSERQSYRARWLFPVDAEPIENGTIEIEEGRITAVHARLDPAARDLGNTALIPGLVNAHTHLEFSDLGRPISPSAPFTGWIRALVAHRRDRVALPGSVISQGISESVRCGVTTVGEIATTDDPYGGEGDDQPTLVVFRELIGLPRERMDGQLAIARRHLEQSAANRETVIAGLSPHAPYSVHPELFGELARLAAKYDAPLAVHLAETRAEWELLAQGTGEFFEMLKAFGAWDAGAIPRGSRPLDYIQAMQDVRRALVIHGNYLSAAELDFVAEREQFTVVYCPRTHAYFGHGNHPWRQLLKRRHDSVALGTDSRASNPDLDLWGEVQFLKQAFPDVLPSLLLRMATLNGAHALGVEADVGSLTPGKRADLAQVALGTGGAGDSSLFASDNRVAATMRAGRWLVRN